MERHTHKRECVAVSEVHPEARMRQRRCGVMDEKVVSKDMSGKLWTVRSGETFSRRRNTCILRRRRADQKK